MQTHEGKKRSRFARRYMDKYGKPTSPELAVTDQSKVMPEHQASNLIDLVLRGEDPDELMGAAIDEIKEGYGGGPFPIGSTVKLNKPWSGPTVEGGTVSLSKGDVVSIVMPNLGEHGQDKMVLLGDGKTRAVVPLDILGESIVENPMQGYGGVGGGSMSQGPSGHAIPAMKGTPGGLIQQKVIGQEKPKDLPEKPSVKTATSHPANPVGQGKPKDDPSAQKPGSSSPTSQPSVAVEAVFNALEAMLNGVDDVTYRRIAEFAEVLTDTNDPGAFAEAYEMLYGEGSFTFNDLEAMFEEGDEMDDDDLDDMDPEERKKYLAKFRKKYRGKYADMPDKARKMMMKYGSNHAKKMASKK